MPSLARLSFRDICVSTEQFQREIALNPDGEKEL